MIGFPRLGYASAVTGTLKSRGRVGVRDMMTGGRYSDLVPSRLRCKVSGLALVRGVIGYVSIHNGSGCNN